MFKVICDCACGLAAMIIAAIGMLLLVAYVARNQPFAQERSFVPLQLKRASKRKLAKLRKRK